MIEHLDGLRGLPALIAPGTRARAIAAQTHAFFEVIAEHHADEERERVELVVARLMAEHRPIDATWSGLKREN